jgi:hypothetical protein
MQEVGTIKGVAVAWIGNYYLSQHIQYILYSGSESYKSVELLKLNYYYYYLMILLLLFFY